jgi:hypothetical protein
MFIIIIEIYCICVTSLHGMSPVCNVHTYNVLSSYKLKKKKWKYIPLSNITIQTFIECWLNFISVSMQAQTHRQLLATFQFQKIYSIVIRRDEYKIYSLSKEPAQWACFSLAPDRQHLSKPRFASVGNLFSPPMHLNFSLQFRGDAQIMH